MSDEQEWMLEEDDVERAQKIVHGRFEMLNDELSVSAFPTPTSKTMAADIEKAKRVVRNTRIIVNHVRDGFCSGIPLINKQRKVYEIGNSEAFWMECTTLGMLEAPVTAITFRWSKRYPARSFGFRRRGTRASELALIT